ncbi:helix-turn-helix transcriptional regulator [Halomicroarcula sp. GCM10025817]|uniref:helix-turn-helix transcriptional regulator n=1 Tax=Haloarcula TaxID=2237 RepID=UPI0023E8B3CC|nr:hypothetical protein [Halomicroarcula sp. SYNS111]
MDGTRVVGIVLVALLVTQAGAAQTLPDTDNTVTRISVAADGDAEWTVTVRTRLHDESDVQAYRTFQERVRENRSRYLGPFRDRLTGVVATAADGTGRSMTAENFAISTRVQQVPRQWGVVEYTFTWTAFARTDGDALVVGDVFDGGLFIARNDTLVVTGPPSYGVAAVTPTPQTREGETVSWVGPREFADSRPQVRYAPQAERDVTSTGQPLAGRQVGVAPFVVGALGLAVALVGAVLYRRRRKGGVSTDDAGAGTAAEAGAAPIQTDGDRVVRLLEERGGQVKQSAIAEAFDWSASKTSRVVSDLTDDGRVEKLRIGRENVVSLPDEREE